MSKLKPASPLEPRSSAPSRMSRPRLSRRQGKVLTGLAAATAATVGLSALTIAPALASTTLTEAGSSLMFPLFQIWAPAYHKYTNGSVTISPAAGGSGLGISEATSGTVDIGASDAYLSPADMSASPSLENIPIAISAQMINYNVPGITKHLKLSGKVLSDIYQGKITKWNSSAIAAINPGVKLPSLKIIALHRSDGSGDSFIFTQYLSKSDPSGWGAKYSYNTAYPGPSISNSLAENGNGGMVTGCAATKGCIAYIGISYRSMTNSDGLGEAMLQNGEGNYLLPGAASITAEAAHYASKVPANEAISMIDGPVAGGYPIVNFEYAIVNKRQSSSSRASAIRNFLTWASSPTKGSATKYLYQVNFEPLPSSVLFQSAAQLARIS